MNVNIAGLPQLQIPSAHYNNCHVFTHDVICELATLNQLNNANVVNVIPNLNNANGNVPAIIGIYQQLIQNTGIGFDRTNHLNMPIPSLVLFCFPNGPGNNNLMIQHSMICIGQNSWEGANNLGSLGMTGTDVCIYNNINNYMHHLGTNGGWNGNNMFSAMDNPAAGAIPYTMIYVPL